jgi:predicted nucleic acid-binding protein
MYLDSDIIFALLKLSDRHQSFATQIAETKEELYTSTITLTELAIVVKREMSDDLSMNLMEAISRKFPKLKIVSTDAKSFNESMELRKKYGMGIFDSLHAAIALNHDKRIASTDHVYDRIKILNRIKPK